MLCHDHLDQGHYDCGFGDYHCGNYLVGARSNREPLLDRYQDSARSDGGTAGCPTVAHTPRQVAVNQEEIKVKLLCRTIHIPVQEVDSVVHYPCGIPSVRLCGAGQFFGNLGLFNSEVCGTYYSFATRNGDVCLIYRKGKKPIAVSVDKPEIFEGLDLPYPSKGGGK